MKILYDAMGGDHAPEAIIEGAKMAHDKLGIEVDFVGKAEIIQPLLKKNNLNSSIIEASSVIDNDEDPAMAIRKKKDSSIVVGYKALKDKKYDGFLSAGSTGALLAGGLFIAKRLAGVTRAALPIQIPSIKGQTLLMDSGANMDTTPEMLLNFGRMATIFMKSSMDLENPRVGLLNVGTESAKGNKLAIETYKLLQASDLNFVGNIEGRDIFFDKADIIITDGFVGNVLLKTVEGTAAYVGRLLKSYMDKNPPSQEAGLYMQGLIDHFKEILDYRNTGGAPLLGIQQAVVKAHGSSDAQSIFSASKVLVHMVEANVIEKMNHQ